MNCTLTHNVVGEMKNVEELQHGLCLRSLVRSFREVGVRLQPRSVLCARHDTQQEEEKEPAHHMSTWPQESRTRTERLAARPRGERSESATKKKAKRTLGGKEKVSRCRRKVATMR